MSSSSFPLNDCLHFLNIIGTKKTNLAPCDNSAFEYETKHQDSIFLKMLRGGNSSSNQESFRSYSEEPKRMKKNSETKNPEIDQNIFNFLRFHLINNVKEKITVPSLLKNMIKSSLSRESHIPGIDNEYYVKGPSSGLKKFKKEKNSRKTCEKRTERSDTPTSTRSTRRKVKDINWPQYLYSENEISIKMNP